LTWALSQGETRSDEHGTDLCRFDESTLLHIALAYERAHDWRDRHPKLD